MATLPQVGVTHGFHDRELVTGGVVGAWMASDGPIGIGVDHGYRAVGDPLTVTRSEGELVLELDGRPALEVYLETLGAPKRILENPEEFHRFGLSHPLVLNRGRGPLQARCVSEPWTERGALRCIAEVPQGGLVWAASADVDATIAAAQKACAQALAELGGAEPKALLVFDCVGRHYLLGNDGAAAELAVLREAAGRAALAGFYTYGEIARTRGVSGFHNKAVVVVALA